MFWNIQLEVLIYTWYSTTFSKIQVLHLGLNGEPYKYNNCIFDQIMFLASLIVVWLIIIP